MTPRANITGVAALSWLRRGPYVFGNPFRLGRANIGARLAGCFVAIVLSMIAADAVAIWQFSRTAAPNRRLVQADQTSLSVLRVQLDLNIFRESLTALASTHDLRQFTTEAVALKQKFVQDVARSEELLSSPADAGQDPTIRSALETLRIMLAAQLDSAVELASAGDWTAVRARLHDQVQDLVDGSSLLVNKVDREVSQERAEAIQSNRRARAQLLLVLPATALITLLAAVALGWYVTRSITDPLCELEAGANALAQGDFQHQVAIEGEHELARLGHVFNDTARRLAALYDTLRTSEARLRLTIDTIPAYVWSALPDGSIDFINQRWLEFSGLSLEQGLGWAWEDTIHVEDRAHFVEAWREAIGSGKPMESEARVRRADGEYRWLLVRNVPLQDESGNIVKWYGTSSDIDDRKRAEEALRCSEFYLAEAQRLTHTGTWALNPGAKKYVYWSDEMYRMWGLDPRNGLPALESVADRLHPEDRERVVDSFRRTLRDEKDTADEYRIALPDRALKYVYTRRHPVFNSKGELIEFVATAMDVTEQYRNRAALEKAFEEIKTLKDQLYKENLALREEVVRTSMFEEIVGTSKALEAVLAQVSKVAPTDSTVLITGQTGTGKELIARAIHKRSNRSARAFISVNCATLAPSLISSELFGYEKGAFTGAIQRHIGRFELADGGTIFLDEVGEIPLETQIALLRVLQEREFERVGGTQSIHVDVRVVAATNRDLRTAISNGTFRQDLFYRLNVFPIALPPLRERKDDILMLVEYFVQRYATRAGKNIRSIDKNTLQLFQSYGWPGNVRELQNVVERSVILTAGDVLRVDESWFSQESSEPPPLMQASPPLAAWQPEEREIIEAALAESRGRVSGPNGAAAKLGIPQSTLAYKIKALNIRRDQFRYR